MAVESNLAWPSSTWITRMSTLRSSKWVAKEWRLCLQRHRRHYISFRTMSGDEAGLAKFTCRWWILSALMPNDTRHSLLGITNY